MSAAVSVSEGALGRPAAQVDNTRGATAAVSSAASVLPVLHTSLILAPPSPSNIGPYTARQSIESFLSTRSALDSLIERRLQVKFRATLLAGQSPPIRRSCFPRNIHTPRPSLQDFTNLENWNETHGHQFAFSSLHRAV